ncbi:MAG: uL14 family ribosomal protein [Candidatus Parvarchaeota archaeon]|jgi:Ribosomal protein L14|nr:uL14 family ribosomal protein [Candidatus Parvarchaeota archaeon]MCL5101029.1 uL14 family ribosomal protein [Candidatus Parvarchaeota archaeon]
MGTGRKGGGLKPMRAKISKAINVGSWINVTDNSGAKIAKVVNVRGYHGVKDRQPRCGVGDTVFVVVKRGSPDTIHKKFPAVIVRQKKPFRRLDGNRICFEDNACAIVKDIEKYEPQGTILRGPIPKEISFRFPHITKISSKVI